MCHGKFTPKERYPRKDKKKPSYNRTVKHKYDENDEFSEAYCAHAQ